MSLACSASSCWPLYVLAGTRTCCTAFSNLKCAYVSAWLLLRVQLLFPMLGVTITHDGQGSHVISWDGPWAPILPACPAAILQTTHGGLTVVLAGNCIDAGPVGDLA